AQEPRREGLRISGSPEDGQRTWPPRPPCMVGSKRFFQRPVRSAGNGWIRCFRSRLIPRGNCVDQGRGRKPNVETRSRSSRPRDPKRCERPSSPCGGEGKTPRSRWLFHGRVLGTLVG